MTNSYPVRLPKTTFSMKARLNQTEPRTLDLWGDLYEKLPQDSNKLFVLHDGPPYANGHLHMGHALNRILKDIILKYKRLKGFFAPFVPGWDCHGLPIEWMVEEEYRKKKKPLTDKLSFREDCRQFAEKWVNIQKEESKRLGILGNWKEPYLTMTPQVEGEVVAQLHHFLMRGHLYRGVKPVQWSVVEKTALAEAEVEYRDKESLSVYVAFPIQSSSLHLLEGALALIWTTTPWSLPANRAIAFGETITYALVRTPTRKLLLAKDAVSGLMKRIGITEYTIIDTFEGGALHGTKACHPLYDKGYTHDVPFLAAAHVTTEQGTGLVHTAPSHGLDDFFLGQTHGLEIPSLVGDDGVYTQDTPLFAGTHIFKVALPLCESLGEYLLHKETITHSYPHSWRSKAPLIYRATPQWFVRMQNLRSKSLQEIDEVKWIPEQGKKRITSMVSDRPDWCISRQRMWGIPIAIFLHKETREPLKNDEVNAHLVRCIREHGSDIWFSWPIEKLLPMLAEPHLYERCTDILDVWFESGTSHAYVLQNHPQLTFPADLYLEGSDQHRGWFQSSLITACATQQKAPFNAVLTHGFIVDGQGKKMSKSEGNALTLKDALGTYGADILRLWVAGSDVTEDMRISHSILEHHVDIYRKLRNVLRFFLGNLHGFDDEDMVEYDDLPELEQLMLARVFSLDKHIDAQLEEYDIHSIFSSIYTFCVQDLSAFYFDIRKDSLYCDSDTSDTYKATVTVLATIFKRLCLWLSPFISFTADEAFRHRYARCVHEETLHGPSPKWQSDALLKKWHVIREVRRHITSCIERERSSGRIKSSLEASPTLWVQDDTLLALLMSVPLQDIVITSSIQYENTEPPQEAHKVDDKLAIRIDLSQGAKCARCWKILPEVIDDVCERCGGAL